MSGLPYGHFHNAKPKHKTTPKQKPNSFGEDIINTFLSEFIVTRGSEYIVLEDVTALGQRVFWYKASGSYEVYTCENLRKLIT